MAMSDGLWLRRSSKGPRTTRQLLNQNAIRAIDPIPLGRSMYRREEDL